MKNTLFLVLFLGQLLTAAGQDEMVQHHTGIELNVNAFQLNSSVVDNIWGSQIRLNAFLQERIELLNSASFLFRDSETYFQNDLRIRMWGGSAGKWHPGFAAEIGHLWQTEDWLQEGVTENLEATHGFLFGGTWYFPLDVLEKGFVVAKWAYVLVPDHSNMTIFNCYVHWNIWKKIGLHVGGDIYTRFDNLKYSGFVLGLSYQFLK